jgi:hypothetical protein
VAPDAVVITRVVLRVAPGALIAATLAGGLCSAVTYITVNGNQAATTAAIARLNTVR